MDSILSLIVSPAYYVDLNGPNELEGPTKAEDRLEQYRPEATNGSIIELITVPTMTIVCSARGCYSQSTG